MMFAGSMVILMSAMLGQGDRLPTAEIHYGPNPSAVERPEPYWPGSGAKTPTPPRPAGTNLPTGVVLSKSTTLKVGETWTGGGGHAETKGPSEAEKGKGKKPDVYLTIIGPKKEREQVRDRLVRDGGFAEIARQMGSRLVVEAYDPSNPLVSEVGLVSDGHPDIIVMDATGKELYRYKSDPGPLVLIEAVRRADPNYKPGGGGGAEPLEFGIGWLIAGFVAIWLMTRPRREP